MTVRGAAGMERGGHAFDHIDTAHPGLLDQLDRANHVLSIRVELPAAPRAASVDAFLIHGRERS